MSIEARTAATMTVDTCPGCGSSDYETLGEPGPPYDMNLSGEVFTQPSFEVRKCCNCHLHFKSHRLSPDRLGEFYGKLEFEEWEPDYLFPTDLQILNQLKKLDEKTSILDYGCSIARLSRRLAETHDVYGYEMDKRATAIASEHGLTMFGSEDELFHSGNQFDAIILMDVFEHLVNPTEYMERLTSLLAPGGRLLVLTGNGDSRAYNEDPAMFWYPRIMGHLSFITRAYAESQASALGLTLTEWIECCHYQTPLKGRFTQLLKRSLYRGANSSNARWWERFLVGLPPFRRARNWKQPTEYTCTKDHVLAVFEKQHSMKQNQAATKPDLTASTIGEESK